MCPTSVCLSVCTNEGIWKTQQKLTWLGVNVLQWNVEMIKFWWHLILTFDPYSYFYIFHWQDNCSQLENYWPDFAEMYTVMNVSWFYESNKQSGNIRLWPLTLKATTDGSMQKSASLRHSLITVVVVVDAAAVTTTLHLRKEVFTLFVFFCDYLVKCWPILIICNIAA